MDKQYEQQKTLDYLSAKCETLYMYNMYTRIHIIFWYYMRFTYVWTRTSEWHTQSDLKQLRFECVGGTHVRQCWWFLPLSHRYNNNQPMTTLLNQASCATNPCALTYTLIKALLFCKQQHTNTHHIRPTFVHACQYHTRQHSKPRCARPIWSLLYIIHMIIIRETMVWKFWNNILNNMHKTHPKT